jgi:hypothetical protein
VLVLNLAQQFQDLGQAQTAASFIKAMLAVLLSRVASLDLAVLEASLSSAHLTLRLDVSLR